MTVRYTVTDHDTGDQHPCDWWANAIDRAAMLRHAGAETISIRSSADGILHATHDATGWDMAPAQDWTPPTR